MMTWSCFSQTGIQFIGVISDSCNHAYSVLSSKTLVDCSSLDSLGLDYSRLDSTEALLPVVTKKMHALVLCAGFGTRLRPLTSVIPKPAVPVGPIPAALRNIEQLLDAGFELVHCNTHYLAEELERQIRAAALSRGWPTDKRVCFWNEPDILETGGGIARIVKTHSTNCGHSELWDSLVVSGDIVADIPLQRMLDTWAKRSSQDVALMASIALKSPRKDVTWVDAAMKNIVGFGADASPEHAATLGWQPRIFSNHQILAGRVLARSAVEKRSSIDLFYRRALQLREKIMHVALDDASMWFDIGTPESYFDCIDKLSLYSDAESGWSKSIIRICSEEDHLDQGDHSDQRDHSDQGDHSDQRDLNTTTRPHIDHPDTNQETHLRNRLTNGRPEVWGWMGRLHVFPKSLEPQLEALLSVLEKKNDPVTQTSGLRITTRLGSFLSHGGQTHATTSYSQTPSSSRIRRGFLDVPFPSCLAPHPLCQTPLLIPFNHLLDPTNHPSDLSEPFFWLLITPPKP